MPKSSMIISDIIPYPVWCGHRNLLIVKVETECGVYGWGESGMSSRELAVAGVVEHFREFLIGKPVNQIGAIWQELYRSQYFEGGRVLTGAISAIDIALWDIAGKRFQVPVYELMGGQQRREIPCFATSVEIMDETLADDVFRLAKEGWRVIRATTGDSPDPNGSMEYDVRQNIGRAAEALIEARSRIDSSIVLGIDMHHRLSVAEAASFCQKMPTGTIDFLEEPIRQQTPESYATLRSMTDVPFAIGEEWSSKWEARPFIEKGLTNFARIDVCNIGGLTEARKVAAMAETHYIDVMPHDPLGPICTAATNHLCASIPNLAWTEIANYSPDKSDHDRLFKGRPIAKAGSFPLPSAVGIGIDVNESLLKEKAFEFWEAPRRYKPDGSFTNW